MTEALLKHKQEKIIIINECASEGRSVLIAAISASCHPWETSPEVGTVECGSRFCEFPYCFRGDWEGSTGGEETVLPAHVSLPIPMVPWAPPEGPPRCEEMRHSSVHPGPRTPTGLRGVGGSPTDEHGPLGWAWPCSPLAVPERRHPSNRWGH